MIKEIREPKEYIDQLINIWESAVKSTHHFLILSDFNFYKEHLPLYFNHVKLFGYYDEEEVLVAFIGVDRDVIEMLFVDDSNRGNGVGKALLNFAVNSLGVQRVDVNEKNTQAVGFYQYMGFKEVGRSAVDGEGKPYPLLNLSL